nr:MAG TPA: Permuted papain-like amidase enzyme, YaeF/YiiX, C92 family [Caudoviricetes sp.]
MILKEVSMNNIDLKEVNVPSEIKYYTHDAFDITVLSSNVNQYLKTEYTVSIAGQIKKVIGKTGIVNDIMKKMVKVIPLDFIGIGSLIDDEVELVDNLYKRLSDAERREKCTVFIHRDYYKVAKKLDIDNPGKYLGKLIVNAIKDSMHKSWTRHEIASKVEDILLEVSTLTDTRCQVYMSSNRVSSMIAFVFLDYLLSDERDFTFHKELIFALSRDMFYKTKVDNVLGILKKNRADLGPLMWMLMEILEKDRLNTNPLYMMEKIAHLGSDIGLDVSNAMRKLLFNNYMNPEAFDTKAYSENFEALGTTNQNIVSQVTGLYLSNNPNTIASFSVPEELSGSTIDNVDIKWSKDSLRTMNYKKIAKNIDKLEEARLDIKTEEDRQSVLETAKHIISDIYDIQNSDDNKYPEMEVLLDKLQEIITDIHNQPLGIEEDELSTSGEGVVGAVGAIGSGIIKLPSTIVRMFKMLGRPLDIFRWDKEYEDERKAGNDYKNKGPMLAKRFFMKIDEIVDKAIPNSIKIGPLAINTDKMNNQRMLKNLRKQDKKRFIREKVKEKWRNTAKESVDSYIEDFVNYESYYVGKEDAMDMVKAAGRKTVAASKATFKAGKNAWRWYTIKKAFKEAMIAINYIAENNSVNDYEIRRIAMDHIKRWESISYAMEENSETEKLALKIRKELIKFRTKLAKKNINTSNGHDMDAREESYSDYIKSTTPGYESYLEGFEEDGSEDDKKKYKDKEGRPFRDKLENHMEEDDSEEKEEALEDFEDSVLDKLKNKGALSDEDAEDLKGSAESVVDFFRDNGFRRMDPKVLNSKLKELEEKIASTDNIKKKSKLEDIRSSMLEFVERSKSIKMKDIVKFQKPGKAYLVFHEGTTDIGKAISIFTHSPFSHCDIVIDNEVFTVVESSGKFEINPEKNVVVYELTPKVSVRKLKEFFKEEYNKGYNYGGIVKSQILGFTTKNKERFKAYFCSQYVIAAIDYASDKQFKFKGKPLLEFGYDYFSPKRLFNFMQQSNGLVKNKTTLR